MDKKTTADIDKIIDDQLELQVDISFKPHYSFLKKNHLPECQTVLDLGTGNGLFLHKLALHNPEIRFYGVDNNAHRLEQARSLQSDNLHWSKGDINNFAAMPFLKSINGVLMRYFALHAPNIGEILFNLYRDLSPNTILWIIDLDLNYFICDPPHTAFDLLKNLVERFCRKYSLDSHAAGRLPGILEQVGFRLHGAEIEPFTNRLVDTQLFNKFLTQEAILYHHAMEGRLDSDNLRHIRRFIEDIVPLDKYFVQYGISMICARKN